MPGVAAAIASIRTRGSPGPEAPVLRTALPPPCDREAGVNENSAATRLEVA
ncbi:hypothetical protein SCE1572_51585 [Sorangium cellulosum So0157-2]|uniref:Uncharacterized protein n=1 Tax=Sorangium cellulosum So0157-2 TaxID=1254432 RepID=S4YBH5_SORCE|nr:hypothetical protein SCE1572_51585 [Sorangium cellulosum So0157-2]